MQGSVLLKRIIGLVLATIVLSAVLTYTIFTFIARDEFTEIRKRDLLPRAQRIASSYSSYVEEGTREKLEEFLHVFTSSDDAAWGGKLRIYSVSTGSFLKSSEKQNPGNQLPSSLDSSNNAGNAGSSALNQPPGNKNKTAQDDDMIDFDPLKGSINSDFEAISESELLEMLVSTLPEVLSGVNVDRTLNTQTTNIGYLVVGVPIITSDNTVIGAVFFAKPLTELHTALSGLNRTLFLSLQVITILMLLPCLLVARRITRPINRMRDVALSMAQGNFSVLIEVTQKGEIGQLANSINYLSSALSTTISDLVVERNRLREIVEGLNEGIVAVDVKGMVTHHNGAASELYQVERNDNPELQPSYFSQNLQSDFDYVVQENKPVFKKTTIKNRILRVAINPLTGQNDRIVGAVGLIRDITESERLEQTRRDYVANVSHELRTPVASIRAMAETLNDNLVKTEEDKSRYYSNIVHESLRLSRLINDLLELSRLQSNNVAFEKEDIDIPELLKETAQSFAPMIDDMDLLLMFDIVPGLSSGHGNKDRLQQVLVILLDNAIKYSQPGGEIALDAKQTDNVITISVSDTGSGIDSEDLEHIFDRFYKADKAHATKGVGLGLSIAKELIDRMGEKISVKSKFGKGTTFEFTVHTPACQPEDAPA